MFSEKVPHAGVFANSFHLTNYEYSLKTPAEPSKEEKEADFDYRTLKHSKVISKVEMQPENPDFNYKFWVASA